MIDYKRLRELDLPCLPFVAEIRGPKDVYLRHRTGGGRMATSDEIALLDALEAERDDRASACLSDDEILLAAYAIRAESDAAMRREEEEIEHRIAECDVFLDDELVYSATTRCKCGAGIAYPRGIGMRGSWICADWLTDRNGARDDFRKHDEYPFTEWEVKSENQPSAHGATTRPSGAPQGEAK